MPGVIVFGQNAEGAERNGWLLGTPRLRHRSLPASAVSAKFLLFGFLGGFILNLMPCVLPVISLKIFGFIQHAGQSRSRIFRSGLAFVAGIFAWFIGLALFLIVLRAAGREIAWALQFTNPYFVLGMSAVVLVFALNLFGVFEITLPQSANRGLLAWTAREGDAGSFFQGVFATVLATPCTAPFLGTALGFAFTQSGCDYPAMFVAIAAGMSAPYLLLCAQPAWLRLLPKPGAWMVHVKQLMGFFLLATLLFLLCVLGAQRGVEAHHLDLLLPARPQLACWMKGAFLVPTASRAHALRRARAHARARPRQRLVISSATKFAAPKLAVGETPLAGDWQHFTPERLQTELEQGHAVFVDFTAAWCITCKFNEATVLESSAVREAFNPRGIIKLKADWTNADPAITKIIETIWPAGCPTVCALSGGKSRTDRLPGTADQEHRPGKTRNHHARTSLLNKIMKTKLLLTALTQLRSPPRSLRADSPAVGSAAPDFSVPDSKGKTQSFRSTKASTSCWNGSIRNALS